MHFFNFFLLAFAGFAFSKLSTEPAPKEMKLTPLSMWTDIVMWQKPIKEFVRLRNMKLGPEGMIWEADGCTSAAEKPLGWDFTNACNRHDFGYRNFKYQQRFTKENDKLIDLNFKKEMLNQCKIEDGSKSACKLMAQMYYEGVRKFGKRDGLQRMLNATVTGADEEDFKIEMNGEGLRILLAHGDDEEQRSPTFSQSCFFGYVGV